MAHKWRIYHDMSYVNKAVRFGEGWELHIIDHLPLLSVVDKSESRMIQPERVGAYSKIPDPHGVVIRTGTARVRKRGVRAGGRVIFFFRTMYVTPGCCKSPQ